MFRLIYRWIFSFTGLFACLGLFAQSQWPVTFRGNDSIVYRLFQPWPDSVYGNRIAFHSVISWIEKEGRRERYATCTATAELQVDRIHRVFGLTGLQIGTIRTTEKKDPGFPRKELLEPALTAACQDLSMDEWISLLCLYPEQYALTVYGELNYAPPRILFTTRPSRLIRIDGAPRFQYNRKWDLMAAVNTPFTIIQSDDNWYYLYGGRQWYMAPAASGPYFPISYLPAGMARVQQAILTANAKQEEDTQPVAGKQPPELLLAFEPAELIQTDGEPQFMPIPGTALSYITNSPNDLFLDRNAGMYYLLLSGRWYRSDSLSGGWQFTGSGTLPADFTLIPETSPRGNALASVAGTVPALEALVDARIPQTARISRDIMTDTVRYDGYPRFVTIRGTHLQYAANTSSLILRRRNTFFQLDRGIWFTSHNPGGPWALSTRRPEGVDAIPPDYPVYISKFASIYHFSDTTIDAGFTTGYLNSFTDGPTLVYGTGFTYYAWNGSVYYPVPQTWGFNMQWASGTGWHFGNEYPLDWFNTGVAWGEGFWTGGWWGPSVWCPPSAKHRLILQAGPVPNIADRLLADRQGRIFRRDEQGNWMQYQEGQWDMISTTGTNMQPLLDRMWYLQNRGEWKSHFREIPSQAMPVSR